MPFDPTGPADPSARTPVPDPDATPGGRSRPPSDPAADTPADAAAATAGPVPVGRYELVGEIGHGGMGVVLRGRDPVLGRELAVKVLSPALSGRPAYVRRFEEEARVGGRLQHPGVVPVYDLGRLADGRPFFAMKLVGGRTLADLLAARPDPAHDRPRFVGIFLQVCQAVAYAHSRGVLHRDLKPQNVMVGDFGEVLVMDWGLAKVLADGPEAVVPRDAEPGTAPAEMTSPGTALGTPAYMPPEQARGEALDERADVFGLGAVLCAVLTGRPPYSGKGKAVRAMAAAGELATAFARLDGCGADAELVVLCKRCLAAGREDRPRDAGVVAGAVAAYRAGVEDRARRAEVERAEAEVRVREGRKRLRVQQGLAVSLLAVVGMAGLGAFWWQKTEADRRVVEAERAGAEERLRENVGRAVTLAADLRRQYRFGEAKATLDQALGLIPADGPADLRAALEQAAADLAFVVELDAIRMRRSVYVTRPGEGGDFDSGSAPPAYRAAFAAHGLDVAGDPAAGGGRIRSSAVRAELVAALDDWAAYEPDPGVRGNVLAAARAANPGPWLDRFRDPAARGDPARVRALAAEAAPAALPPATLTALSALMERHDLDPTRVLAAAQFAHPGDFLIPYELGLGATGRGDPTAVAHYRTARVMRPRNTVVLNNLGVALARTGDLDGAAACYREATGIDPGFAIAHANLGLTLSKKGDYGRAAACLREAVRLAPDDGQAHSGLGTALYRAGDYAGAAGCYREAVRLAPADAENWYNLGTALERGGDRDEAAGCYRKAIRLDRRHAEAHYNLGVLLGTGGDPDGALAFFRETVRLDGRHADAHHNIGVALVSKGDLDGATAAFREAVRLDPNNPAFERNLALTLRRQAERDAMLAPPPREVKR